MKKFGLLVAGGIAAIVLFSNLGPMVGLVVTLAIAYYSLKRFLKAQTTMKKFLWGALGIIMLCAAISNVPSIIGLVAAYVLYVVYKKWNESKVEIVEKNDPFTNFENEWKNLNK
ncbi:flagellar basal body rod protein [Peribacillus alkalitolerans]|uniref:lmo0954 family membrane protein n=1 Tax=Peribacillus alkalitolerans TaxID=1550385 RepID=UPI0013D3DB36|nr:flagellar basal body rod protein [Peribacillus alkalitolerans]